MIKKKKLGFYWLIPLECSPPVILNGVGRIFCTSIHSLLSFSPTFGCVYHIVVVIGEFFEEKLPF